jgi:predicted dehydrogenase
MSLPPSRVRVGIIGVGIGRQHLRGYLGVPGAHITAICDLDTVRAAQMAQENGLEGVRIFSDYRDLLAAKATDAVSICLPNSLHAPVAVDCLEAGQHVLCEKPLAIDAAQAQKIADAQVKSGKLCMVGQVLRFRDDILAIKKEIESGKIGEIYYVRTMARRIAGIPKWGGWFTQSKFAGGGPLIDTGVHMLDLAWWLSGCPQPLSASGTNYAKFGPRQQGLGAGGAANLQGTFDVEDLAAGLVRFENGLSIHFEATWAIHAPKDERFCHLHGTEGAIIWDDAPKVIDRDGVVSSITAAGGDAWTQEMAHFIDCVQNGKTPNPDAAQGITIMKILDALYQSARENKEISI